MQKLVDWLKKQKSWDNWTIMMHLPSRGKCPQWMHVGRGFCQGWKTTELCWRLQLSSINFMNKYVLSLTFCLLFAGVLFDIVSYWIDTFFNFFWLARTYAWWINFSLTKECGSCFWQALKSIELGNNRDSHHQLSQWVFGDLLLYGYSFHLCHIKSVSRFIFKDS